MIADSNRTEISKYNPVLGSGIDDAGIEICGVIVTPSMALFQVFVTRVAHSTHAQSILVEVHCKSAEAVPVSANSRADRKE
jgi:hypothetical protein